MRIPEAVHDVLIVGAGPAGLTAAITLARHGVDVLVVEKHAGTSPFPKATGISTRTMELLRGWNLERAVRAGAMRVRPFTSVSDTLVGPELATVSFGYPTDAEALAVSPVTSGYAPQDHLEPVLLAHLVEHGGTVRFDTRLVDLQVHDGGVLAELRHAGEQGGSERRSRVAARYVIGADAPRSAVRSALDIGFDELGSLGEFVAVTFRADLTRRLTRIPAAINSVQHPAATGLFVPTSTDDRWIYAGVWPAGRGHPRSGHPPRHWVELLRAGTGLPDLAPRIGSVQPFEMAGQVARAYRSGPAFLVGDAAHRTTPMGGTGMNTAIHAAHNLGWKLAWVLNGWAGAALLDSYQDERRPVGVAVVQRSLDPDPDPEPSGLARDIGVRYTSAVLAAGTGSRAPHAWVRHRGSRISTLDLFDGRLTVLTGPRGEGWSRAAAELAADGLPVVALAAGKDLLPEDGTFAAGYGVGGSGAALVRPDGFLAWQHPGPDVEARAELRAAVQRALGRPAGASATAAQGLPAAAGRSGRPPRPSRPARRPCRPAA